MTTSSVLKSQYLPQPDNTLTVLSGSSLNKKHYCMLNKHHFLNNPLYFKYQTGTFLTHGSSPELYMQGSLNNEKSIRMSYLYNDNQLVSFNDTVPKHQLDKIHTSYNELFKFIISIILNYLLELYKFTQYLTLRFLI